MTQLAALSKVEIFRISDKIKNTKSYASLDTLNDLLSSGCLSTGVSGDSKNLTFRLFNGTVEIGVENWKLSISLFAGASLLIWLNVVSCLGDVLSVLNDVFCIGEVTGKWADSSGVSSKECSLLDLKQYFSFSSILSQSPSFIWLDKYFNITRFVCWSPGAKIIK